MEATLDCMERAQKEDDWAWTSKSSQIGKIRTFATISRERVRFVKHVLEQSIPRAILGLHLHRTLLPMNLHPITQVATDLPSSLLAFSMPSGMEWLVVLAIGLLLFGKRLPEVGRSLGQGINEFKKGLKDVDGGAKDGASTPAARSQDQLTSGNAQSTSSTQRSETTSH